MNGEIGQAEAGDGGGGTGRGVFFCDFRNIIIQNFAVPWLSSPTHTCTDCDPPSADPPSILQNCFCRWSSCMIFFPTDHLEKSNLETISVRKMYVFFSIAFVDSKGGGA